MVRHVAVNGSLIIKEDLTIEVEHEEYLEEINTELLKKMAEIAAYDWNGLYECGKGEPQQALSMRKDNLIQTHAQNGVKTMISHFSEHDFKGTQPGIARVNAGGHEQ
jgi:hypothetical protein